MKHFFCILSVILISNHSFSQQAGLPKDYQKIKEVSGDLDKDGIKEKVVVYNVSGGIDHINGVDREVIVFKNIKGNWISWHRSLTAVGNSKDGGMMGDPFEDIEIKNGILLISQSGGSSWKWGHVDKYRYQNKHFELIGYSNRFGKLCEYWAEVDYNLSTGKVHYKKEFEKCDGDGENQVIYKTEEENFFFKAQKKITFKNRKAGELIIVTPKYKEKLYI